jgi:hypothetical protein
VGRDHFTDLVTYILEDLVGTGSDRIAITIQREDRYARVTISGNCTTASTKKIPRERSFLTRLCERAGGTLTCAEEGDIRGFVIALGLV